jgi:hypothetical protein
VQKLHLLASRATSREEVAAAQSSQLEVVERRKKWPAPLQRWRAGAFIRAAGVSGAARWSLPYGLAARHGDEGQRCAVLNLLTAIVTLRQYDSFHSRLDRRDHLREEGHLRREAVVSPRHGLTTAPAYLDRCSPATTAPNEGVHVPSQRSQCVSTAGAAVLLSTQGTRNGEAEDQSAASSSAIRIPYQPNWQALLPGRQPPCLQRADRA